MPRSVCAVTLVELLWPLKMWFALIGALIRRNVDCDSIANLSTNGDLDPSLGLIVVLALFTTRTQTCTHLPFALQGSRRYGGGHGDTAGPRAARPAGPAAVAVSACPHRLRALRCRSAPQSRLGPRVSAALVDGVSNSCIPLCHSQREPAVKPGTARVAAEDEVSRMLPRSSHQSADNPAGRNGFGRSAGSDYARVVRDIERARVQPDDTVSAVFQSACPRNSLKNGRAAASFLDVEWLDDTSGSWIAVSLSVALVPFDGGLLPPSSYGFVPDCCPQALMLMGSGMCAAVAASYNWPEEEADCLLAKRTLSWGRSSCPRVSEADNGVTSLPCWLCRHRILTAVSAMTGVHRQRRQHDVFTGSARTRCPRSRRPRSRGAFRLTRCPAPTRLRHRGDFKHIFGGTTPFSGVSRESLSGPCSQLRCDKPDGCWHEPRAVL